MVTQDIYGIDSQFLNPVWLKALFVKDSLKNARLISDMFETVVKLNDIPKTTIPFDPYAIAPFTLSEPFKIPEWIMKDDSYKLLWEYAVNNKSIDQLKVHPMKMNRLVRQFIRHVLTSNQDRFTTSQLSEVT